MSAFIVEKGSEGLHPGKKENKLGCRACETTSLSLDNLFVPEENLVGEEGEAFIAALEILDGGRIVIAAVALGIARGALDVSLAYSKEREQFGCPIGEFQSIRFKLADMATRIEAARLLTYQAAALKQTRKLVTRESSMAKLFASEVSVWVAEQAVQIHGGYGYIKDYGVEKLWRDSKVTTIGEGTSEIQRMIIARELLANSPWKHEKESVIKPVIPEVQHQVKGILKGDVHTIARSISRLEADVWSDASLQLLRELYAHTGKAFVLGITGSPGVGKSTLVDRLIERFRAGGSRVAVLAVDPTSPFSGGAILGDRIRMQRHSTDPDVFIRSMATRGKLGGLAPAVHEALIVLDASGYDCILLETVGVGQAEVDVVFTAHMVLVVLAPGLGDEVQTIKAGLMEIADVFVLNKVDLEGTDRSEKEILALLELAGGEYRISSTYGQDRSHRGQWS